DRIQAALEAKGSSAVIFDPADAVACETITRFGSQGSGKVKVFTSRNSEIFISRVKEVFGDVEISVVK
ncbi:MAG: hypothetical protein P8J32_06570, partial [bacterium]|nr:hypothetical protein [bacterium]